MHIAYRIDIAGEALRFHIIHSEIARHIILHGSGRFSVSLAAEDTADTAFRFHSIAGKPEDSFFQL